MTDTTGYKRQIVYRVKFYIESHNQGEKPEYLTDEQFDDMDLTGETIERDVLARNFEEAIEIAKRTMSEDRMGKGLIFETTSCEEISRPENAEYVKNI